VRATANPLFGQTLSIRHRHWLVVVVNIVVLAIVGVATSISLRETAQSAELMGRLSQLQKAQQNIDMYHDSLRAEVMALLSEHNPLHWDTAELLAEFNADTALFRSALQTMATLDGGAVINESTARVLPPARDYIDFATLLIQQTRSGSAVEPAQAARFRELFLGVKEQQQQLTDDIEQAINEAKVASTALADRGMYHMLVAIVCAAFILLASNLLVSGSIRRSISAMVAASRAISSGNFGQQLAIRSNDELGELAQCLNHMGGSLKQMIERLQYDAKRDSFSKEVVEALEMADTEREVHDTIGRSLARITDQPTELLLADSSRANLERATCHPTAGGPGCSVTTPFNCIAVRRGNLISFPDSDALNACPRLRGRECGSVSAVCIPINFMGRSLGVLHVTGKVGELPAPEVAEQLNTLSHHAGARIGTVRAFDKTQRLAATDSLTGLANRWSGEERISRLGRSATHYAFVMADLDNFKKLNDTHGHHAGDKALKLFSQVLRKILRAEDMPCRWGGEEFAIIMPNANAGAALQVIERIRRELVVAIEAANCSPFTSSFGLADSTMAADFDGVSGIADEALYKSKQEGRNRATIGTVHSITSGKQPRKTDAEAKIDVLLLGGVS
jgi:diguanylate cyclase (GGDEF)-like protein